MSEHWLEALDSGIGKEYPFKTPTTGSRQGVLNICVKWERFRFGSLTMYTRVRKKRCKASKVSGLWYWIRGGGNE